MCVSGLSTFEGALRGRNIVIHSDNTTAEHGLRKGRARSFDHTAIVHSVWTKLLEMGAVLCSVHCNVLWYAWPVQARTRT